MSRCTCALFCSLFLLLFFLFHCLASIVYRFVLLTFLFLLYSEYTLDICANHIIYGSQEHMRNILTVNWKAEVTTGQPYAPAILSSLYIPQRNIPTTWSSALYINSCFGSCSGQMAQPHRVCSSLSGRHRHGRRAESAAEIPPLQHLSAVTWTRYHPCYRE